MKVALYFIPKRDNFKHEGKMLKAEWEMSGADFGLRTNKMVNLITLNDTRFGIKPYAIVAFDDPRAYSMMCEEVEEYINAIEGRVVLSIKGQGWGVGFD